MRLICLLLLFSLPALCARAAEVAPWPAGTKLAEQTDKGSGVKISMPPGGDWVTEAELGIDPAADEMTYVLNWANDKSAVNFDMLMVGVIERSRQFDDESYAELLASEHADLLESFPDALVEPEAFCPSGSDYVWDYAVYRRSGTDVEIVRFSTWEGSRYYSLFFYGRIGQGEPLQNWAQITAVLATFAAE